LKYRLRIAEETVDVDVSDSPGKKEDIQFAINRREYHVRYKVLSSDHLHLSVDGKATEAFVARGDAGKYVSIRGRSFLVQDEDHTSLRRTRRRASEEAPGEVSPPMPSVVIRIMTAEGDMVTKGQGLLVVSAMKMETTLSAPFSGRVRKVNTFVNAKVAPGDILVEIEEQGAGNE